MRDKVGLVIRLVTITTDDGIVTLAAINDRLAPAPDDGGDGVAVMLSERPAAAGVQRRDAR
jgi:hypothetical protein